MYIHTSEIRRICYMFSVITNNINSPEVVKRRITTHDPRYFLLVRNGSCVALIK